MTQQISFWKRSLAAGLAVLCASPAVWAQQSISPIRGGGFFGAYKTPEIPATRLSNSGRLASLIQGGKLYLTAQDAIALALENNIDIETSRYNALITETQYTRAQAGGPLPGIVSVSSQAGQVASGQGVAGVQAAAGVSSGGNGNNGNASNTTVTQIGPVTPTLDPTYQSVESFSHRSAPQPNATLSQTTNLIDNTRNYQQSITQGIITGGKATLTFSDSYLNENAPNLLNPTSAVVAQLSLQHNLLYGFGRALNARTITVAKANIGINDLTFKVTVIGVVANVLNAYYSLVADYQDIKAKRQALDVAQRFFADNKKQVEIGTMAPLDVTTAEAQVATSEQNLVVSETTLQQEQVALKNLLSRTGLADPLLADVEIIPLDRIDVPENETLPSVKESVATAMANRVDLEVNKLNEINTQTSNLGTANAVLPSLVGIANLRTQGLTGNPQTIRVSGDSGAAGSTGIPVGFVACPPNVGPRGSVCQVPNNYFVGGFGNAVGQAFRRDFPSQSVGVFFGPNLRNRSAQADQAIDALSLRQVQLENRRTLNQVMVDVSNQLIGLQQARIRYLAAVKNRVLEEQLLQAEQRKFALGASTTFNVVTQQRDLATAQSAEVASLVSYSSARVSLDQTLGTTLKTNNVLIDEASRGTVTRPSALPTTLPQPQ